MGGSGKDTRDRTDGTSDSEALTNIGHQTDGSLTSLVGASETPTSDDRPPRDRDRDRDRSSGPPSNPDAQRAYAVTLTSRSGERYVLGAQIARGGMGEVLAATDAQMGREVAVKRMRQQHPSDRSMGRFFREACIQGRLDHPAIVPVYELGCDEDGRPFFAMKKLAGTTLQARIEAGEPWQKLLRAFVDACLAVELAHTRGIVHRDLKPANIVLGDFGDTYVLDWGVAKIVGDDRDEVGRDDTADGSPASRISAVDLPMSDAPHTADGIALGTIGYMAPEQARGERDVDARADVYALGCTLFEILAGQPLHVRGSDGRAALASTQTGVDARPSVRAPSREIPPELDTVCVGATALERSQRIPSARALADNVQRYLDGDRDLATRREMALRELGAARLAFEKRDDQNARKAAMRHAGRALALDPTLEGAAELVSRLMLEPPSTIPPEVEREVVAGEVSTLPDASRAGVVGYTGFAILLPLFATGGWSAVAYIAVLLAVLLVNAGLLLVPGYNHLRRYTIAVAVGHAVLIGLLAHMFSPFLVAPGVAAVITMALVFSPIYRGLGVIALVTLMVIAIVGPYAAEVTGLVGPKTLIDRGGISTFPVLRLDPAVWKMCLVIYTISLVAAAGGIAYAMRRSERRVRQQLVLQSWQLQQLVAR